MTTPIKSPRKLIEVALPLDAINEAAAKEKSIRHGHPSTLHLWWARRPLAAARAVLFAQLVNDPGFQHGGGFKYGMNKKDAAKERKRLFNIIEELVQWENTTNEEVLERARAEIRRSWREVCELNKEHPQAVDLFNPDKMPGLYDPFAGGGAIPLEAQRLGLESYASDLNPVAVLINKAMIEIPPKFSGRPPVHPPDDSQFSSLNTQRQWRGASGFAEDFRYYGRWMRAEAQKRIGDIYPLVRVTQEMAINRPDLKQLVGQNLMAIAWIWVRTVKSPNPVYSHVDVPLASTFILSSKEGKEAYISPVVEGDSYRFEVVRGIPPASAKAGTKAARGSNFRCIVSDTPISADYVMRHSAEKGFGLRLMAIVVDSDQGRVYLPPLINVPPPKSIPDLTFLEHPMTNDKRWFSPPLYGMPNWRDIFTPRQLVALTTLSDLVSEARELIRRDAISSGLPDDDKSLDSGGSQARSYSEAVASLLGLAVSRSTNSINSLVVWSQSREQSVNLFSRQAIPMAWDFPEVNPFSGAAGDFGVTTTSMARSLENVPLCPAPGVVTQADAQRQSIGKNKFISTDPPYYDNIGYGDLSDFFYVWLRRALRSTFPTLLATITVPKREELVASPHRHGSEEQAERFFLDGMKQAMRNIAEQAHPAAPITIYYAFKQSDTNASTGTSSAGWETFLEALQNAGLRLVGTWPFRTERPTGVKVNTNSLASSIVLVCRKRAHDAPTVSRREFQRELNAVLPEALDEMTKGSGEERSPVAPVDLSQAIIGPGMAVFSKYAAVLEADGSPMTVRTALQLINRFLAEDDFDHDTQFCLHWFEQHGWKEGAFGEADTLARAKGTSVEGVRDAGVIQSGGGKVRLLKWSEYPSDWDPREDKRLPIWEGLHHLIRALRQGGDSASGALLAALGGKSEAVRQLAYRLYTLCERLGQADDARAYNELITSWTGIESAAATAPQTPKQGEMFQ